MKFLSFIVLMLSCFGAVAASIHNSFPNTIHPAQHYVFYSHGYIVEGDNPTPKHNRWGVYDFPAIQKALSGEGIQLISEHRAKDTNPFEHGRKLSQQVNRLIDNGVPAKQITLVGFSRGGFITAIASSYLANKDINFVILAACTSGLAKREEVVLHGHILSIYETSDTVGSCDDVIRRSPDSATSYTEISISTGKEHGAFYTPIEPWLLPVKSWIAAKQVQ